MDIRLRTSKYNRLRPIKFLGDTFDGIRNRLKRWQMPFGFLCGRRERAEEMERGNSR